MKIAYGTYAMPTIPLEEAIPMLARIGYEGVEIMVGPHHIGSMPEELTPARRAKMRGLLAEHNFGVPAVMTLVAHCLEPDDQAHQRNLEFTRQIVSLIRDLGVSRTPVVAMGFGGTTDRWLQDRDLMAQRLRDYAALAARDDFILAGEAHSGAAVDRTERALWVINAVDDSRVRLHFDIVHFFLAGEPVEESVASLVPITAHTHITDTRRTADGKRRMVLLGQGELPATTYVRAMAKAGWTDFITLEVSASVWRSEGYDPLDASVVCYRAIDSAFQQAGVSRG